MSLFKSTLIAATFLVSASSAFAAANLVPDFNTNNGMVRVHNNGADPAGRSIVTVNCTPGAGTSCPDPTAAQAAPYEIGGYPNVVAIRTGQIKAGKTFQHKIAFFNSLVFAPGTYYFTVCADAGNHVAESNEGDNCKRFSKTVR